MKTKVIFIDKDGNVYLEKKNFEKSNFVLGDSLIITIDGQNLIRVPFYSGLYCEAFGTVLVCKNNSIFLAIRNGNAEKKYNLREGQNIYVRLMNRGDYWEKENAYSFTEINDRKNYNSEESFANFRPLFHDVSYFYRSSSPIDNAYYRAESTRCCVEKYGIKTIINMADTVEEYNSLFMLLNDKEASILQNCTVYPIGNDSGLYSREFEQSVLTAMKLITNSETPCLIHCRAGKRRSGFICAILQSLYGMNSEEIMADYMVSYENNNRIVYSDNPKRYEYLKNDTIRKILCYINGVNLNDLVASTTKYLERIGLSKEGIEELIAKLR